MYRPLFAGSIADTGFYVGHATNRARRTGVTAILAPEGAVCGVAVRGAAPGTRETDLLKSENTVKFVHAVMLCGGSAFGLDAVSGAMNFLEKRGIGFDTGRFKVPIVPAAVLYDLDPMRERYTPCADFGVLACINAMASKRYPRKMPVQGSIGAGTGATLGKLLPDAEKARGGIGTSSLIGEYTVAAIVAVNAVGDVYHPHTGALLASGKQGGKPVAAMETLINVQKVSLVGSVEEGFAGSSEENFVGSSKESFVGNPDESFIKNSKVGFVGGSAGVNTTIGVIATNAPLTKAQCNRLASVAHDGLAISIRPVHTPMDGDTLFAMSPGDEELDTRRFMLLCAMAVEAVARAVANAAVCAGGEVF